MNEYSLITKKDFPTHRLIIKKSDGNFKIIRIKIDEAKKILEQMKDWKVPYIELSNSVEIYPKNDCRLEKLDKDGVSISKDCYILEAEKLKEQEREKSEIEKMLKVDKWIEKNKMEFAEILKKSKVEIFKKYNNGLFSEKTLFSLAKNMARIEIGKNI